MKIMIDTNVLISAFVFGGKPRIVLEQLLVSDNEVWVSEYVEREFADKMNEKWPEKSKQLIELLKKLPFKFCESTQHMEGVLRDQKDIPVLSDALYYCMDIILTGDKDFLEANLEKPLIFSPAMMEKYLK